MDAEVMTDYFSEEKAASDLGVTVATLRNWAAKRQGPVRTKVARRVYYRKDAMQQWLLAQEERPGAALTAAGAVPGHAGGNGHAVNGQGARA